MPLTKSQTIWKWKSRGLIYDDYDELYEIYIKTMNCGHCNKEFKNTTNRCMDHNHETGRFRKIVCRECNINDRYIKYPNGYDGKVYSQQYYQDNKKEKLQYQQQYRKDNIEQIKQKEKQYREYNKEELKQKKNQYYQHNKEELKQKRMQKITCLCGSVIRSGDISRHEKTQKHLNNMDIYMENID